MKNKDKIDKYIKCTNCKSKGNFSSSEVLETCGWCKGYGYVKNPKLELCNNCGGNLCCGSTREETLEPYGLHNAEVSGGYCSSHLYDMTRYNFSICEKCLRDMFNNFKIPPTTSGYSLSTYNVDKANHQYYRVYAKSEEFNKAYLAGKCNFVEGCNHKAKYTIVDSSKKLTKYSICYKHSKAKIERFNNKKMEEDVVDFVPDHIRLLE